MLFLLLLIPFLTPFQLNPINRSYISEWSTLKSAINQSEDGDVIYVDDVDFTSGTDGLYSELERITISKSITLIGKEEGSVFRHDSLN